MRCMGRKRRLARPVCIIAMYSISTASLYHPQSTLDDITPFSPSGIKTYTNTFLASESLHKILSAAIEFTMCIVMKIIELYTCL